MKSSTLTRRTQWGFTLIELLVVISIIAILAAMILPALSAAKRHAQAADAKMQIGQIASAVAEYESTYSRFPVSADAVKSAGATNDDFTYGGTFRRPDGSSLVIESTGTYKANNSEVMAVLLDLEYYQGGTPTINKGHVKNTHGPFLNAKMVSDTTSPGVGSDGVYRDPWGNPYIISFDLNGDGKCRDAFYRLDSVSLKQNQIGFNGLSNPSGTPNSFEYNGTFMIWSLGPDKSTDPSSKANLGGNKDNVLSWN